MRFLFTFVIFGLMITGCSKELDPLPEAITIQTCSNCSDENQYVAEKIVIPSCSSGQWTTFETSYQIEPTSTNPKVTLRHYQDNQRQVCMQSGTAVAILQE